MTLVMREPASRRDDGVGHGIAPVVRAITLLNFDLFPESSNVILRSPQFFDFVRWLGNRLGVEARSAEVVLDVETAVSALFAMSHFHWFGLRLGFCQLGFRCECVVVLTSLDLEQLVGTVADHVDAFVANGNALE